VVKLLIRRFSLAFRSLKLRAAMAEDMEKKKTKRRFVSLLRERKRLPPSSSGDVSGIGRPAEMASRSPLIPADLSTNITVTSDGVVDDDEAKKGDDQVPPRMILRSASSDSPFQPRKLVVSAAVLVGRATGKHSPTEGNAFFEAKVLSRAHAVLWFESNAFFVKDVNSANGTAVNGRRLAPEARQKLEDGDVIQFGADVFVDARERHRCVVANIKLLFPNDPENDLDWKGNQAKEDQEESILVPRDSLVKLRQSLDEATLRESKLCSRLRELGDVLEKIKALAFKEWWVNMVGEDVLLSKISMLTEELDGKGVERNRIDRRLRFEENAKKLLFKASKAKVAAEIRAFRAESAAGNRERPGDLLDVATQMEREEGDASSQTDGGEPTSGQRGDVDSSSIVAILCEQQMESQQRLAFRLKRLEAIVDTLKRFAVMLLLLRTISCPRNL